MKGPTAMKRIVLRCVLLLMICAAAATAPAAEGPVDLVITGARTMSIDDQVGVVAPGMKAHLIIFEQSPLDDPRGLLSTKTVIKDGVVLSLDD
jgi:imidazolonepropionase-like amidohydrolase